MTNLSEDPTYLAGGLLLLAGVFVVALNITQQGKYLVRAGIMLGLAFAVVAVEWFWVTDNERIEQVVYALRQAVLNSDADDVIVQMAPNVQYLQADTALSEDETRAMIKDTLSQAEFEFVRISDLQISVGQQSRRGQAEFRVFTRGRLHSSLGMAELGTAVTTWSLGFQETEPGVWKVSRISPVSMPARNSGLPGGRAMRGRVALWFQRENPRLSSPWQGKSPQVWRTAPLNHSHVEFASSTKLVRLSREIRLVLEIRIFQYDQLVLVLVVAVFLVWRKLRKRDAVRLDDHSHELFVILGISVIFGAKKIHGVLHLVD